MNLAAHDRIQVVEVEGGGGLKYMDDFVVLLYSETAEKGTTSNIQSLRTTLVRVSQIAEGIAQNVSR